MRSLALIFRIGLAVAGTLNGRYKSECDIRLVDDKSAHHSAMLKHDFEDGFRNCVTGDGHNYGGTLNYGPEFSGRGKLSRGEGKGTRATGKLESGQSYK